jgi:hypothetical protein
VFFTGNSEKKQKNHFELSMLKTEDPNILKETQELFENISPASRVSILATIKHMFRLANSHTSRPDLRLDPKLIELTGSFEDYSVACVEASRQCTAAPCSG